MSLSIHTLVAIFFITSTLSTFGQSREEKVRADKAKVESEGLWIYNDFDTALARSKASGKPILVALRCIPCEECVKLDDDLVDQDPVIEPLLKKFICVRIVGTNGLDLNTFQYDTDQSFAMFMLNADKTIYGRFGTRSHRTEWVTDVSVEGMARALEGALELHANYPANKQQLAGKQAQPLEFASPELYPSLKAKYTDSLNYKGDVVKSCIHCHQIGDARRDYYWQKSQPIPEKLIFPYPHPKSIGLILDPKECAFVKSVVPQTAASRAGLQAGDTIKSIDGQPILSTADLQWVLHNLTGEGVKTTLSVVRDQREIPLTLTLDKGWRSQGDTSWRVSSWWFSGVALGGMRLEPSRDAANPGMALRVKSVGKFGKHAKAKQVGFQVGDILTSFDGQTDFQKESDLFAYVGDHLNPSSKVVIQLIRNGKERTLTLPMQR